MNLDNQFYQLSPERICQAAESFGFVPTGRLIQLNSFENRVYQIDREDGPPVIAKFYRPGRWSIDEILEEHEFMRDLAEEGMWVGPALKNAKGESLGEQNSILFAFFPKHLGRMPDELLAGDLQRIGRSLARIHNVGERKDFLSRIHLDGQDYGWEDLDALEDWIDPSLRRAYQQTATALINHYIDQSQNIPFQRIHGDCHRGNLLNNGEDFFFVDFDDALMGPVAQDLWMILAGATDEERDLFLNAYTELRTLDPQQLSLFPLLQAMRIIHYSAWIAKRWQDPNFPKLFPQFQSFNYWAEELEKLNALLR